LDYESINKIKTLVTKTEFKKNQQLFKKKLRDPLKKKKRKKKKKDRKKKERHTDLILLVY